MAATTVVTCEVYATRLSDPGLELSLKVKIATELRDSVEIFQSVEYARFLSILMPVFTDILMNGQPVFVSHALEQKLRGTILEIVHRFPHNDSFRQYAPDLLKLLMHLLRVENEDNAVICLKTIIDLHRSYKQILESQVQPFIDIVQEMYRNMEQTVKDNFDNPGTPLGQTPGGPSALTSPRPVSPASELSDQPSKVLAKSLFSFKVLTECPIIVVLLFQTHRQFVNPNIATFIPLIIQTLGLQASQQAEAQRLAAAHGEVFVGVSPAIRNRSVYTDFIVAQVKTMSFLAYILRGSANALRPHQNAIPDFVIRLLRDCPPEAAATRKELLVATRHILSIDFRQAFVPKIDILLNENVLVGTGVTSHETLRPLAYSMLADLVHHVRAELTPEQLAKTVYIYSRNLHDPSLASSIQTMCAKLLLNLVDCIVRIPNGGGKIHLIKILDTFTNKFAALNLAFPGILKQTERKKNGDETAEDDFDFEKARSIHTASSSDIQADPAKDGRFLFKNLVAGLKTILINLKNLNDPAAAGGTNTVAREYVQEQSEIFTRLFQEGLKCFDYYTLDGVDNGASAPKPSNDKSVLDAAPTGRLGPTSKEEKETLEHFALVFTIADPAIFQEVFTSQMGFLLEQTLHNISLLQIPQFFLANENVSQNFAGILFRFLVDRLDKLGGDDQNYSSVILRLFKLAFMAVTLFPDANESVLQPHLGTIIMDSIKLSAKAKEPVNYFILLRSLFRSIGGGRFELLYNEVKPLLQVLLESLNSLLALANKQHMRELFVELCLTVPVRLSVLLPYLNYLMNPLVLALQASQDLVSQGLRTMELCIDNLTQEFLDPIMAPVITELMNGLWRHLKPLPYSPLLSHIAMRILGKLGGRNRRMLKNPPKLQHHTPADVGVDIKMYFDPSMKPHTLPLDAVLTLAGQTIEDANAHIFYREHAYKFLKGCVPLLIDTSLGPEGLEQQIQRRISIFTSNESPSRAAANSNAMDVDREPGDLSKFDIKRSHAQRSPPAGKKLAQERALNLVLRSLFMAASIDELKEDAWPFLQGLIHHFALLQVGEALDFKESKSLTFDVHHIKGQMHLDTNVFVDAVVDIMTSENLSLRKLAESGLQLLHETCTTITSSKDVLFQLPVFHLFATRFSSSCYKQEWYRKSGGCFGISIMCSQLDMGSKWMLDHELEFVKALLYILKDMSPELATGNVDDATKTLSHVLKVCNRPEENNPESSDRQAKFNSLIGLLISELSNSNSSVRETIQSSFQLLADLTGSDVTELLAPVRDRLLSPIFAKPLRALPFAMQIGHIDAITFCLSLRPPFLEFNDELIRLLHEALALADAEDQALVPRASQYKNTSSLINLRIVCIKLLSAAMACPEFCSPKQNTTRQRIISVFFKSLYSKSSEVVDVANKGLKQVLAQQHKLPRDLLQAGLRPILMNLSDYKRLTVAGLEGLARLLELLTNYFKVEIGKKLLDHLRQWAEPSMLQECAGKPLSENQEIKIIVGILNVFCLLPQAANIFLNDLVTVVLEMESHLRRAMSSPFRHSLLKFLNRYSDEAVDYFLDRLTQDRHSRLFVDLLSTEFAAPLRSEIVKNPEKLISKTFQASDPAVQFHGLTITRAISKFNPELIPTNRPVLDALLAMWRAPGRLERLQKEEELEVARLRESQYLVEAFILHLKQSPDDIEVIFEMISIFTQETVIDFSFLKMFYIEEIAIKAPAARKRAILEHFLVMFQDREVSQSVKMQSLRVIINPMLLVSFTRGPLDYLNVIDHAMIAEIHSKIWQPLLIKNPDDNQYNDDALRIELLQMTSLILQFASDLIADARKDIIMFGWNYLKLDDITGKQAAYVLIARFIAAYDTPSKIIIQIYVALLRAHQSEAKALVKQALDIVAPVLPKRIANASDPPKNPTWARWTQRVLVEDGYSGSQLMNVYQLLVRHPDLFYESREHFLPQIVTTLSKLGLVQNAGMDSRTLTINLAELILKWERRRITETKSAMDVDTPATSEGSNASGAVASASSTTSYTPNLGLRENVVSFLVRFACAFPEPLSKKGLPYRAVELLREFLGSEFWPEVNVKLQFLERTLLPPELTELNQVVACNSLEVLLVLIQNKSGPWFLSHIAQLYRLLDKCLLSDNPRIVTNLQPIMDLIYKHISASAAASVTLSSDVQSFIGAVDTIINDGLQNLTNLYSVLTLIQSSCQHRQDAIDAFVPGVMKVVSKLTKDHISPGASNANLPPGPDSPSNLLITALRLLKLRISHLGDQRRWFLTSLIQLIEKSTDIELSRAILDMATEWVTGKTETFPTIKEKASLMVKMMCLETRGDKKLVEDFLELVVTIYNDPSFARSELTVRLEQAFLMGTRSDNPRLRNQFAEIFDRSIGRSLYTRLTYVIGGQSWEYLGGQCWLQQALDILLGVVIKPRVLSLSSDGLQTKPIQRVGVSCTEKKDETEVAEIPELSAFLVKHREFLAQINQMNTNDVLLPLKQLQHLDVNATHRLWTDLFPLYWSATSTKEKQELTKILIPLLAKEYHNKQQDARPNVIQALLEGISRCSPAIRLPPHLVKYLGKKFCAWHTSTHLLQSSIPDGKPGDSSGVKDEEKLRNSTLDALAELYTALGEDDMFYGLWRRRCLYSETNAAISYEQNGMWQQAQIMYEGAVNKARTGVEQFTVSEYSLWEDHWITCTQKLQSWDILTDLAKHENNTELQLESNWRLSDWTAERENMEQLVYSITEAPTPRRRVFESFLALIKAYQPNAQSSEPNTQEFSKLCEEGVQLSLWKWHTLPEVVSQTHVPLLQVFQQFVELTEANQIYQSLASTTALNLESKSTDLKSTLQTWRERLPNTWDDINVWSDLVAWRQHIFSAINKTYLPLIQNLPSVTPGTSSSNSNSFAYRGYHETAWIINRFAHVARKHQLAEVCINQLTKIYTLPNIEIQEAFLKLREQAKCHFQNEAELTTGLEVINNTNLMYFNPNQKAEFFTMKGMFLAKLSLHEEANLAFVNAVQIDLGLAKAWGAWGNYNDQQFKEKPKEIALASHAVSCYLQAAGIYKNSKSRKYLVRIQWLMTQDDSQGTVYRAFENFKGEIPVWYWITFIPQLLMSLTHLKEAKHARHILMKIAKTHPQALHFSLRTLKEEYTSMRKGQQAQQQAQQSQQTPQNQQNSQQGQQSPQQQPSSQPSNPQTPKEQSSQQGQQSPSQTGGSASANPPATPTTPSAVTTPTAQTAPSATTPTPQQTPAVESSPPTATTPVVTTATTPGASAATGPQSPQAGTPTASPGQAAQQPASQAQQGQQAQGQQTPQTPQGQQTPQQTQQQAQLQQQAQQQLLQAQNQVQITAQQLAQGQAQLQMLSQALSHAQATLSALMQQQQQQGQQTPAQAQAQGQAQGQAQAAVQAQINAHAQMQAQVQGQVQAHAQAQAALNQLVTRFPGVALNNPAVSQIRKPWEHVDDIMNILKTAFPLLALSMESMVDQIQQRLKPSPEEDMYRLIVALLTDSFQQLFQRLILNNESEQLSNITEANLTRFSENLFQPQVKAAFVHDFIANKPTLSQFVTRLQRWRDKFEDILDSKPRKQQLENWSHYLAEFQHQKFDDVEVPGQYLLLKDNSNDFVRIDRFEPEVELLRGPMNCSRRLTIGGHDGSVHPFIVQQPASRQGRREERVMQLFRILNGVLERKKESRKRNLFFHLPLIIPLAPQIRILQDDPSYASLHGIYEEHCNMIGIHKDDPIMYYTAKVKAGMDIKKHSDMLSLKMEIAEEIASKMIPETILTDFMTRNMKSYTDLWMIRRQFTAQMASVTFMTYIMSIGHRFPTKWFISLQTGNVWTSDMLPVVSTQTTTINNMEPVPFRFTPNFQHFITPTGVEGVFTSSLMSIARCLTEPEFEFDQYLGIFIRDELVSWFAAGMKTMTEQNLGERVSSTVEQVLKRTSLLSCKPEREKGRGGNIPANQTIIDLISQAENPLKYAQMDCTWLQWL
ncbi:hypothetical protein B0O80DRAFT_498171 [Mortierella sp. GBAus27b]|nr:hypothetical protein BGX31_004215 [Mortierella sp. GBA43]KAI8354990.1 hypothetical protein B0O80DRAFT_498171 [Mortierella sp. GBAus27b]